MKTISFLFVFLMAISSLAQPVPFDQIQSFHDKRVDVIKSNYGLEKDVDISVLIAPKEMKTLNLFSEQKQIKLPGLLLGGIQVERSPASVGMFEIITELEKYKREVTIVKKSKISDEEIQAMVLSLKEHLSLRPDEIVRVEDKSFNFSKAMKNWRTDFKEAIYKGTFKSSKWAWIPISLLVLALMGLMLSWALKSGFGSLGKSLEKIDFSGEGAGAGAGGVASFGDSEGSGGEFEEEVVVSSDSVYETDPLRLFQKITSLYLKSKYELYKILWSNLETEGLQISFYEMMTHTLTDEEISEFRAIYFDIFKLDSGALLHSTKVEELSSETLSKINKGVSMAEMADPILVRERALAAIYPEFGKTVKAIVENSIESFFEVVFYLFPEMVVTAVKSNPELSDVVSRKLPEYLSLPSSERVPGNEMIQDFALHVQTNKGFFKDSVETDIGEYAMKLLSSLPDSEIFSSEFLDSSKFGALKKAVPAVSWINENDPQALRNFLTNLSIEEIAYISNEHFNFQGLLSALDERAVIRINESLDRSFNSTKKVNISVLRKKIAKAFKPKEESEDLIQDEIYNAA